MRVLLACVLLVATAGLAWAAPEEGLRKQDGYQVIMWNLGGVPAQQDLFFQRLRELNVTAVHVSNNESPAPMLSHGFGFYVENIHRIAFMFDTEKVYRDDRAGYIKTRDKQYLIRKPCLHDPAYLAASKQDIQKKIHFFDGTAPLLYNLGDECSITSFASPMDYCFSDFTLAAFRKWLQGQYGSLAALNAEWQTSYKTWDEVVPMTTYEIKDRERTGSENYSPWADHRTFMDLTFSDTWRQFRQWVREVDPHTPVGLEGLQHASAFGGYNMWNLSQAFDWLEPYDICESHSMLRSFQPAGGMLYATVFEHDGAQAGLRLWHNLLNGDKGVIIWCSSDWLDYKSPDMTPQPWTKGLADLFAELRSPAARTIMEATRDRAPIAIHYSHPSVQVAWMLDSREDGDTWPNRHGSWDSEHSWFAKVRGSWCRLLGDLGLQYDFVSTEQILDGTFAKRGYKALILPESLAIGDAEAAKIRAFAQAGGTVVADFLPGAFDQHGKRRAVGALDDLFGVSRATATGQVQQLESSFAEGQSTPRLPEPYLTAAAGKTSPFARNAGKGHAYYLNASPLDYGKLRTQPQGAWFRDRVGEMLNTAGAKPVYAVTLAGGAPVGCEVIGYRAKGKRYLAVIRDQEYTSSQTGELKSTANASDRPVSLDIDLGRASTGKLLLSGQTFRDTRTLQVTLDPRKPVLVEIEAP